MISLLQFLQLEHLQLLPSWHQDPILEQETCLVYQDRQPALTTLKIATTNINLQYIQKILFIFSGNQLFANFL